MQPLLDVMASKLRERMELSLCSIEQAELLAEKFTPKKGEFGIFILALPIAGVSLKAARARARSCSKRKPWPVIIGIPANYSRIIGLAEELMALEQVKDRHELSGDAVARREVYARLVATRSDLEEQVHAAVSLAKWFLICQNGRDALLE